jgi:UDP-N-acetylmuramyl pentapeptide synthase
VGTGGATLVTGVSALDVAPAVREQVQGGDIVLLKGSRGVRLEMLLAAVWPSATPAESH